MLRRLRLSLYLQTRRISLTRRFLLVSAIVVAVAMLVLGAVVSSFVADSITDGVASTAAASVDSLVANSISGISLPTALSDADRRRLDAVFDMGSDVETTKLVQVRIFSLDGRVAYEASDALIDPTQKQEFDLARQGRVTAELVEVSLAPVGPVGSHSLSLLRLYTPLHHEETGQIFGVAALYYSAHGLLETEVRALVVVWIAVLVTGASVGVALFFFIAAADRTITRQRRRLSDQLAASRSLSDRISDLHLASERLRIEAIEANEQLLARVGSDIHDGPLQLLTLIILQLGRPSDKAELRPEGLRAAVNLASNAMTELRNISSGLVLPELASLSLAETILLAIERHEGATGTKVLREIKGLNRRVNADVQVCVYRIVQESLSNAFRHSGGIDQTVAASDAGGMIVLKVSNAVRDTTVVKEESPLRPKLGLRGMQLRVEAVGGGLAIEMSETLVRIDVRIPLNSATQATP